MCNYEQLSIGPVVYFLLACLSEHRVLSLCLILVLLFHCLLLWGFVGSLVSFLVAVMWFSVFCVSSSVSWDVSSVVAIPAQLTFFSSSSIDCECRKYSKTCLKRPLKRRPKIGFQDRLSLNESHSAVL